MTLVDEVICARFRALERHEKRVIMDQISYEVEQSFNGPVERLHPFMAQHFTRIMEAAA